MSEQQQQFEFKELDKFQLFTETPGVPGKRSRLSWSVYRGNPRISVYTNVPNDPEKGFLTAAMNPETFLSFMELLERVTADPQESKYKIECYTTLRKEGNERSNERILKSELFFGRDSAGVIWISVLAPNRPKIKFEYRISDFHKIFKGDGSQLSEAESSTLQATATIRALRGVMTTYMGDIRPPYVPNSNNGGRMQTPTAKISSAGFDDLTF